MPDASVRKAPRGRMNRTPIGAVLFRPPDRPDAVDFYSGACILRVGTAEGVEWQMSSDPIVKFYLGEQPDGHGRSVEEVWAFDATRLEDAPHYIEWLFPLSTKSAHAPDAPLVTSATQAAFASSTDLRERLRRSLDLVLGYYGFARDGDVIARGDSFESRRLGWLYPDDQSHRRLSRVVRSLALLGESGLASSLRDQLVSVADEFGPHSVSGETRGRWTHLLDA
jgi:hypothetical protein